MPSKQKNKFCLVNITAFFIISFCLLTASAARAQFVGFGQNKVQYSDFDWRILAGEHIDLYYYPEEEEIAYLALKEAEEVYNRLSLKFNHHVFRRVPLIIFSAHHYFQQTNVLWGLIPEGVGGVTEFLKGRVALPDRTIEITPEAAKEAMRFIEWEKPLPENDYTLRVALVEDRCLLVHRKYYVVLIDIQKSEMFALQSAFVYVDYEEEK